MKYLKLYENFNNENENILVEFFVVQKEPFEQSYQIGNSNNIREEIKSLVESDDFPKSIYNYEVRFYTEDDHLVREYCGKMETIMEEDYKGDVKVEEIKNSNIQLRYKKQIMPYYRVIRFTVEKTIDDYGKDWPEEGEEPEVPEIDPKELLERILEYIYELGTTIPEDKA